MIDLGFPLFSCMCLMYVQETVHCFIRVLLMLTCLGHAVTNVARRLLIWPLLSWVGRIPVFSVVFATCFPSS